MIVFNRWGHPIIKGIRRPNFLAIRFPRINKYEQERIYDRVMQSA